MPSTFNLRALAGITLGVVLASAPSATAQSAAVTTELVADGLSDPLFVTHAPNDPLRLFIVEQGVGTTADIKILDLATHSVLRTPFLTVTALTGGERGLLGMAFDPDYAVNGYFYIFCCLPRGTFGPYGSNCVMRYTRSTTDPNVADASSAYPILTMTNMVGFHNGGWIAFGPDGFLYVAVGDDGNGLPYHYSQSLAERVGKVLRIDVRADAYPSDPDQNYSVPLSNPFVNTPGALPEIWLYGLRNPWRDSFDRATGDLWIGDVGGDSAEEIDFVPSGASGLNFGWDCMEGNLCTGETSCTCNSPTLTMPVQTYSHKAGSAVIGGYRYRGNALCGWQGTYFYADYYSAQIWSFGFDGTSITNPKNRTSQLHRAGTPWIQDIASFGEDDGGEIYIVDHNGKVFEIVPSPGFPDCNRNGLDDACDIWSGTSHDLDGNGIPDECEQNGGTPYCFGATGCPCGNDSSPAQKAGCRNGSGVGGMLVGSGLTSVSQDGLVLHATSMTGAIAVFVQGTSSIKFAYGDGLLCVGRLVRIGEKPLVGGNADYPIGSDPAISVRGGVPPTGGARYYQTVYRSHDGPCAAGLNITNGVSVVWQP